MKKTAMLLCVLLSVLSIHAQSSIVGIWDTGQKNTKIEIKEGDNGIEGAIFSSDNTEAHIGKQIIKEVQQKGEGYKGKLYAIKKGRWVDALFIRQGEKLVITISAGWRSKTVEWEAAN